MSPDLPGHRSLHPIHLPLGGESGRHPRRGCCALSGDGPQPAGLLDRHPATVLSGEGGLGRSTASVDLRHVWGGSR